MSDMRQCYVYEHYRHTDLKVFYVGLGTHKKGGKYKKYYRASESHPSKRNEYWVRTMKKHGFFHRVVRDNLTIQEACDFEKYLISHYGIDKLCNLSTGGDANGRSLKNEVRNRISKSMKEKWADPKFRNERIKAIKKGSSSIESRIRRSQSAKELKSNDELLKRKVSNHFKKLWEDSSHRKYISEKMKNTWKDQEYRRKMSLRGGKKSCS